MYYMTFVTSSIWYLTFPRPSDILVNFSILFLPKETAMQRSDTFNRIEKRQDGFHTNVQLSVPTLSSHAK